MIINWVVVEVACLGLALVALFKVRKNIRRIDENIKSLEEMLKELVDGWKE